MQNRFSCQVAQGEIPRKVPKFSDTRNFAVIHLKFKLKVFCQKHANGIANSEDPDQTAPLGAV